MNKPPCCALALLLAVHFDCGSSPVSRLKAAGAGSSFDGSLTAGAFGCLRIPDRCAIRIHPAHQINQVLIRISRLAASVPFGLSVLRREPGSNYTVQHGRLRAAVCCNYWQAVT
jgi:hypothetical protein